MKYIGMLKWYDIDKGFGVISMLKPQVSCHEDIFIHHSQWKNGVYTYPIIPLVFETRNRKRGGLEAVKCEAFTGTEEEWMLLFENKEFGYDVVTKFGMRNLMRECVSHIADENCSTNFISAFERWNLTHQVKSLHDIIDITIGGISVNDKKFQEFVTELSKKYISLENRIKQFEGGQIGLYTFHSDEYKLICKYFQPKHFSYIKSKSTDLYVDLLKHSIREYLRDFSFGFDKIQKDYCPYYGGNTCTKITELYKIVQREDTAIKQQIDSIIQTEIENKEEELFCTIERILHELRSKVTLYLNKLLSFPIFIDGLTKQNLNSKSRKYIEEHYSFDIVIDCIYDNVIEIDEEYIGENVNCLTQDSIQKLLNAKISMPEDLYEVICKTYLSQTNDYETISRLVNNRADINNNVLFAIKTTINDNIDQLSKGFIEAASTYLWLGETYLIDLLEKYLLSSNDIESVIYHLYSTDYTRKEDIIKLIYSFWTNEVKPTYILVEKICRRYYVLSKNSQCIKYLEEIVKLLYCTNKNYKEIIELAKLCDDNFVKSIEQYLQTVLAKDDYVKLWSDRYVDSIPLSYYDNYFDGKAEKYINAERWLQENRFTMDDIYQIMETTLISLINKTTASAFRTKYEIFSFLSNHNLADRCKDYIEIDLLNLFGWSYNLEKEKIDIFGTIEITETLPAVKDFDSICRYFILFPERVQIKIFKFIFYCKSCHKIDFQVDDLKKIFTCDSLYANVADIPAMSLSVSVILDTIITYNKEHRFPNDKDFYRLIYSYAKDKDIIPSIGDFFDKCEGKKKRKAPVMNNVERFVYPVIGNDNKRYYIINFPYNDFLVCEVKKIAGRRYHPQRKVWFVPEESFEKVKEFSKNNDFILLSNDVDSMYIGCNLSGLNYDIKKYYQDTWELSSLESVKENNEIQWCEGRESQKEEKDVWWCVGHLPCNACTIKLHPQNEWRKYTLLDFMNILGIDLMERNKYGTFVNGKYALFITSINRFNKLLDKLYCRECGKLLHPIDSNYSVNGTSNFHCINKDCKNYGIHIYLNHCYTLKCRGIIDSRDQAKCPNGLVICASCGTCCTTDMFRYRLDRLINAGSHYIPTDLEYKIRNNMGHKDNNKYFCYKCGNELLNYDGDSYCTDCHTRIIYKNFQPSKKTGQTNNEGNSADFFDVDMLP